MSNRTAINRIYCTPEIEAVLRSGRSHPVRGWAELAQELRISRGAVRRLAADLNLDVTSAPVARREDNWPKDRIVQITQLWSQGLSAVEIGNKMGITKNAVLGKVHRLKLPSRKSPIIRDGRTPKAPRRERSQKPLQIAPRAQGGFSTLTRTLQLAPMVATRPVFVGPTTSCCFPLWKHQERAPRPPIFCGEVSIPGRSYCETHYRRCYVQKPLPEVSSVAA